MFLFIHSNWGGIFVFVTYWQKLPSLFLYDRQKTFEKTGSNSVSGMAALVLLVLSSVSVEFNHCVHSS